MEIFHICCYNVLGTEIQRNSVDNQCHVAINNIGYVKQVENNTILFCMLILNVSNILAQWNVLYLYVYLSLYQVSLYIYISKSFYLSAHNYLMIMTISPQSVPPTQSERKHFLNKFSQWTRLMSDLIFDLKENTDICQDDQSDMVLMKTSWTNIDKVEMMQCSIRKTLSDWNMSRRASFGLPA